MNKKIVMGIMILVLIMLSGCNKHLDEGEISQLIITIPSRMTSLVIEPQFDGIFYANISCRSEYEFTNDTEYLDLVQIERQEFRQEFLEIVDDNIILQFEEKIDKGGYVEFRRYYLPEMRIRFYRSEFENKINLSGYEAYCKTYDSFKFNYKYYDGSFMIKEGEYNCPYYDFRFDCWRGHIGANWYCDEEFSYWETRDHIYDCITRFLEEE